MSIRNDLRTLLPSAPVGTWLNQDVVTLLATHVDYHVALTILAANPSNVSLVRGLYSYHSSFWSLRVGIHTGKIALTAGPWSPKVQHDALLPRSGHLVHMGEYIASAPRVKAIIHAETIGMQVRYGWDSKTSEDITSCSYIILGEDGIVSLLRHEIGLRGKGMSSVQPMTFTNRLGEELEGDEAPRVRLMIQMNPGVACLDHEGRLWVYYTKWQKNTYSTQFVEVVLPAALGGVDAKISYIAPTIMYGHRNYGNLNACTNGINEDRTFDNGILITLTDDGSEHLLSIIIHKKTRVIPVVISIPKDATALAYSSEAASRGWSVPDGHWDEAEDEWVDESAMYPRSSHLIVPDIRDVPVKYTGDETSGEGQALVVRLDRQSRYRIHDDIVVSHAVALSFESTILPPESTCKNVEQVRTSWAAEEVEGYTGKKGRHLSRIPIQPRWTMGGACYEECGLVLAHLFPALTTGHTDPEQGGRDIYIKTALVEFYKYCSILLGDGTRASVYYDNADVENIELKPSKIPIVDGLPAIWVDIGALQRVDEDDTEYENEYGIAV